VGGLIPSLLGLLLVNSSETPCQCGIALEVVRLLGRRSAASIVVVGQQLTSSGFPAASSGSSLFIAMSVSVDSSSEPP
jgi:hypothetical protein